MVCLCDFSFSSRGLPGTDEVTKALIILYLAALMTARKESLIDSKRYEFEVQ